jgi:hypothetical protein
VQKKRYQFTIIALACFFHPIALAKPLSYLGPPGSHPIVSSAGLLQAFKKPARRITGEEGWVPGWEEPHGHSQTSRFFPDFQNCPHAALSRIKFYDIFTRIMQNAIELS